jgi:probable rRNA maturation factor
MKMFLTRLGFGSTMVVTGDVTQVDLPGGATSGLRVVSEILEGIDDVGVLPNSPAARRGPAPARGAASSMPTSSTTPSGPSEGPRVIDSHVTVSNESGIPCDEASLARLAAYLMAELSLHPSCELGITLVDDERMSTLHEDWMHEPGPTDVLSFPIDEITSAAPGGEPVVTTHGMLHLIGHDHQSPESYEAMFSLQDDLLAGWRAS